MQESTSYDSLDGDSNSVLVKLADLGISAFLGPNGFQRKMTTPGYVAPEVLKYSGKEHLTEKVSQFCLCDYIMNNLNMMLRLIYFHWDHYYIQ